MTGIDIQKHRERGRGKKAFWILVGILAVAGLVAVGRGHGRDHAPNRHTSGRHAEVLLEPLQLALAEDAWWLDRLEVTEEQKAQMTALLTDLAPAIDRLEAEREELIAQLVAALESEQIEQEQLQRVHEATQKLTEEAVNAGFEAVVELARALTPEQRADLVAHWRKHQ